MQDNETKETVRKAYGRIALLDKSESDCGCGPDCCDGKKTPPRKKIEESRAEGCGCGPTCCGSATEEFAKGIGYSEEDLKHVPQEANLGLGCGNPTAVAGLKPGEVVLDLGSGAGMDCFLAAAKVGPQGRAIGVDMTPEMIAQARRNAEKAGVKNVEFRLGEIEALPVADNSVDVVISNCVINLSTDKPRVFQEIRRVLKPGGRVAVSDMVLLKELPESVRKDAQAYVGCVAGALFLEDYKKVVLSAGFEDVKFTVKASSSCLSADTKDPVGKELMERLKDKKRVEGYVASLYVEARKGTKT